MSKIDIHVDKLHSACDEGDIESVKEMLFNLKKFQEKVSFVIESHTPLIVAANSGFSEGVEVLIDYGVDVNYRTDLGETALDVACVAKDVKSVQLLLDNGANPLSIDSFGVSVLQRAEDSGDEILLMIKDAAEKREAETANNPSFFQKIKRFFGGSK